MNFESSPRQVLALLCSGASPDIGIYRGPLYLLCMHRLRHTFLFCHQRAGRALIFARPSIDARQDTLSYTIVMAIATTLKGALNDAISSGEFIDTQIILFSRRDSSGRICKPKALYANSNVLKSVPYFNDRKPRSRSTCCACDDPSPGVLSGKFAESETKDFSETVDDGEFAEDYSYTSDSDLEEDWDFASPPPPPGQSQPLQSEALYGEYKEHVRAGNVIRVRDVASITCVFPYSILLLSQPGKASKLSCYFYTLIPSSSLRLDPKRIESRGVLKLPGPKREKYQNRRPNRSTGWRTRLLTLL